MASLRRGDVVLATAPGDYGKPRPGVVIQSDLFNREHPSVSLCPVTSHLVDAPIFRILIEPSRENGLELRSQIMIDKIVTLRRERLRQCIGRIDTETLGRVNRALMVFLGLA